MAFIFDTVFEFSGQNQYFVDEFLLGWYKTLIVDVSNISWWHWLLVDAFSEGNDKNIIFRKKIRISKWFFIFEKFDKFSKNRAKFEKKSPNSKT